MVDMVDISPYSAPSNHTGTPVNTSVARQNSRPDRSQDVADMVQAVTDKNYRDLAQSDEGERSRRNEEMRAAAANPAKAREFLLRTAMLTERI